MLDEQHTIHLYKIKVIMLSRCVNTAPIYQRFPTQRDVDKAYPEHFQLLYRGGIHAS